MVLIPAPVSKHIMTPYPAMTIYQINNYEVPFAASFNAVQCINSKYEIAIPFDNWIKQQQPQHIYSQVPNEFVIHYKNPHGYRKITIKVMRFGAMNIMGIISVDIDINEDSYCHYRKEIRFRYSIEDEDIEKLLELLAMVRTTIANSTQSEFMKSVDYFF